MSLIPSAVAPPRNRLLAALPTADFLRLVPLLEPVELKLRQVIYHTLAPIDWVYFPTAGVVSAMTMMRDGSAIEVATIGLEGVVGLTAFVGGKSSPNETMVQIAGRGLRMRADDFQAAASSDGPLRQLLVRYNTVYAIQVSYAVACNGLHTIEKRCCRWLLETWDRVGSNNLQLTHEFLAVMLGVRRASVTEVLQPLHERGIIANPRGEIEVLDRAGLEHLACECYGAVRHEFDRLYG